MKYIFRKQIIVLAILSFLVGASIIQSINADLLKATEKNKDINDTLLKSQKNTHTLGNDENQPPVADFQFEQDPTNQYVFHFYSEGYSYDPDGEIIYWRWNFNDGTPDSLVLNISNPTYDFSHVAGHDLTISLIVGDDGTPTLFNSTSKILSIDSAYSGSFSDKKIYKTFDLKSKTKSFDNPIKNFKTKNVPSSDCDLYIFNATYSPENPMINRYLYFSFNVGDTMNAYDETSVEIRILFDELNFDVPFYSVEFDNYTKTVYLKLPDINEGTYQLEIWIYPKDNSGWNEVDMSNNVIGLSITIMEPKVDLVNHAYFSTQRTMYNIYDPKIKFNVFCHQSFDKKLFFEDEDPQLLNDINKDLSKRSNSYIIGGECNLYFRSASYCPEIARQDRFLTFYCTFGNKYEQYDFKKIIVKLEIIDLNFNITFDLDYDGQGHELFFRWPYDALLQYDIVLFVFPFSDGGWVDIDFSDNSRSFSDIGIYQNFMILGLISTVEDYYGVIKFNPIFVIMLPTEQKFYLSGAILLMKDYKGYVGRNLIIARGNAAYLS